MYQPEDSDWIIGLVVLMIVMVLVLEVGHAP